MIHERGVTTSRPCLFVNIMKRLFIAFLAFLGLGALGLLLLYWSMFGDRSFFQTGLRQYEGLPATASDITVYRNRNISGVLVADFRISEPDFVSFAAEKHWAIHPITSPVFVFQATAYRDRPNNKKEVVDGLYYSQRLPNGGGVTVAYDRKDGRAHIYRSSR